MLLGSPPDMVHGHSLRKTGSAAAYGGLAIYFTIFFPKWQQKISLSPKLSPKTLNPLPPYGLPRRLQPVFRQKRPPARIQPAVGVN